MKIEKPNIDNLINEFVIEIRKYFIFYPYNKIPFNKNFSNKMKKEWEENVEILKERILYYKYLNKKRNEGVFL